MVILGIDPGHDLHGVARIDVKRSGRFEIIEYGHIKTIEVEDCLRETPCRVAVEKPARIYGGQHAAKAISTANSLFKVRDVVDAFVDLAHALGLTIDRVTPQEWRKAMTGQMAVDDARVATACRLRATNLPRRTNSHERDAMGVAWAAAMKAMSGGAT